MAEADVDGDGYITYDEFKAVSFYFCMPCFLHPARIVVLVLVKSLDEVYLLFRLTL